MTETATTMSSAEYDTVANSGNNTVVATVDDISNHNTIPTRDDAAVFSTKSELVDNTHTTSKNGVHNSVSNSSHSFDPKAVKYDRKNSALHKYYANTSKKSIQLAWEDINFSILGKNAKASTFFKPVKKVQHILRNSSGAVKSGELLAIMGPTGNCFAVSTLIITTAITAVVGISFR